MTGKLVRKFKMVAVWNDDRLEAWLAGLAAQGLVLQGANSAGIYTFRQGPAEALAYRVDYLAPKVANDPDYRQLLADAGWELAAGYGNCQIWATRQGGGNQELFTDGPSRAAKYRLARRLMLAAGFFTVIPVLINAKSLLHGEGWASHAPLALSVVALCAYAYSLRQIGRRIRALTAAPTL